MGSSPLSRGHADRLGELQALFQRYHREELEITDTELDRALGLHVAAPHDGGESLLEALYPADSVVHLATPYPHCRALFQAIQPEEHDLFIDLGCGFGRVVLYGCLTTRARFRGIELIAERADCAHATAAELGLGRVEIVCGNVLGQDFEDGTVFYLFRPFSTATEQQVLARLHRLARERPITVVAHRLQPSLFDEQIFSCGDRGALRIYRSRLATAVER